MTTDAAMIVAAGISSAPAWGALGMAIYTQRRALPRQTSELKAHIDTASAPAAEQPPREPAGEPAQDDGTTPPVRMQPWRRD